jgi:acetylornithine deacetylase/succinyl-diaminopimelate desuccinylase-like protein
VNTVPGKVIFTLDARHPEDTGLAVIVKDIEGYLTLMERDSRSYGLGVKADMRLDFESKAVTFDATAIDCVRAAGKSVTGCSQDVRTMTSGAGHDSVFTSMHCPTAMIFVPCKDGVSHHPEEWCEKEDCATGASVLTEALLRFDQIRHQRGDFT